MCPKKTFFSMITLTARIIRVYAPLIFFSKEDVNVHIMEPYIRMDSTVVLKICLFSFTERFPY